jgi:hypothetical protein
MQVGPKETRIMLRRISTALAGIALLALATAPAPASTYNKKTYLTIDKTIEVPGAVLTPGKYVMKLVDSDSNRHIVQFLNENEDEVLSTVIAIPNTRLRPTGETEFAWYETPAGQPAAMRAWFYPGDNFGQEFAYPKDRATALTQSTDAQVTSLSDEDTALLEQRQREETIIAQAPAPQPQADVDQNRERELQAQRDREEQAQRDRELAAQRDRELAAQRERDLQAQRDRDRTAQAQQSQQQQPDPNVMAQNQPAESQLPETAGFGALFALIGFGSLGASFALRKLRRS